MTFRSFQIPTAGIVGLGLSLAFAACDGGDKDEDDTGNTGETGDTDTDDSGDVIDETAIVGTWNLTQLYGVDAEEYFNYSYTYKGCEYNYKRAISMTITGKSSPFSGDLEQYYSYTNSCSPKDDETYTDNYTLTVTSTGDRTYTIVDEDDVSLDCTLDDDTLTCEGDGSGGKDTGDTGGPEDNTVIFERG